MLLFLFLLDFRCSTLSIFIVELLNFYSPELKFLKDYLNNFLTPY